MENLLNIKQISATINFWLIRTKSGIFYEEFKNNNFIAIGWNNIDKNIIEYLNDSSKKDTKKTFESKKDKVVKDIRDIWGVEKRVASQNLNKSERFIQEVKEGDIVMFPSKGSREITFAIVGKYFEKDISTIKELEVEKRIESKNFDYLKETCPYKKCRNIEIVKTISGSRIHPKLYEALVSRHGISAINDYSEHVLSSIYTLYCWKNKLNLAIRIEQKDRIDGFEFSRLMYNMSKIIKECNDDIELATRMNLNSPGWLELIIGFGNNAADIIQNPYVIKAISIIGISICGGKYGDKTINSFLDVVMKWKKLNSELKDNELYREQKRKEIKREDIITEQAKNKLEQERISTEMAKEKLEQEKIRTQVGKKIIDNISIKEISEASNKLCVNQNELAKVINIFEFMDEK